MGETIQGWLQAVGIRTRLRAMERGTFHDGMAREEAARRGADDQRVSGKRGTRLSHSSRRTAPSRTVLCPRSTTSSTSGARAGPKEARALLHQIQKILHEQVTQAPIYHSASRSASGPAWRIMATAIPGFYTSPVRDLKLRP